MLLWLFDLLQTGTGAHVGMCMSQTQNLAPHAEGAAHAQLAAVPKCNEALV